MIYAVRNSLTFIYKPALLTLQTQVLNLRLSDYSIFTIIFKGKFQYQYLADSTVQLVASTAAPFAPL